MRSVVRTDTIRIIPRSAIITRQSDWSRCCASTSCGTGSTCWTLARRKRYDSRSMCRFAGIDLVHCVCEYFFFVVLLPEERKNLIAVIKAWFRKIILWLRKLNNNRKFNESLNRTVIEMRCQILSLFAQHFSQW